MMDSKEVIKKQNALKVLKRKRYELESDLAAYEVAIKTIQDQVCEYYKELEKAEERVMNNESK